MPTLIGVFRSICSITVDDGIVFDPESVAGTEIRKDGGYGSTPEAQPITYPTLLVDVPAPTRRAYPKATVVAEKLHAVTVLGMTNTRMKDFFDLWVLLNDFKLDVAPASIASADASSAHDQA